jgi:hypothetical protein
VERVAGIEPALSAWESVPFMPVTRPDLRGRVSAGDRERPLVTGVSGPLQAAGRLDGHRTGASGVSPYSASRPSSAASPAASSLIRAGQQLAVPAGQRDVVVVFGPVDPAVNLHPFPPFCSMWLLLAQA